MANRRRSDRIAVSLPVWLKDGQGGERTLTANISTHGIAVFSPKPRALRQYMELELSLPSPRATISVTAMVTRLADLIKPDGQRTPGIGLDFFLFDGQAKASWQQYLQNLRGGDGDAFEAPAMSTLPVLEPEDDGETPTFIIKPRDLGRLWAFYRGELTKGVVRIETPVPKSVGAQVELLVVHPSSQAEWILAGKVARATPQTRMGRPVLEIGLVGLGPELRTSFRNFVSSGRGMIEEDVSVSSPGPLLPRPPTWPLGFPPPSPRFDEQEIASVPDRIDPFSGERIPSEVVDLDSVEELFSSEATSSPEPEGPTPEEVPVLIEIDLTSEPSLPIPTTLAQRPEPTPEAPPEPARSVHLEEEPTFISIDSETSAPSIPIAVVPFDVHLLPESEPETRLESEPEPADSPLPTKIFASFFAEAAASSTPPDGPQPVDLDQWSEEPRINSDIDAHGLPTVLSEAYAGPLLELPRPNSIKALPPPLPMIVDEPDSAIEEPRPLPPQALTGDLAVPPMLPAPPLVAAPSVPNAAPRPVNQSPELSGLHLVGRGGEPIALRPKPAAVPIAPPTSASPPEVIRSLPETARLRHDLKVVRGDLTFAPRITPFIQATPSSPEAEKRDGPKITRSRVEGNVAQNPPMPPGTFLDFSADDDPAEHSADELPVKMPGSSVAARRAAVRQSVENQNSHHKNLSTASGDPDLARDIALARARVIRSPHSVTACYRLSMLLVRDGQEQAFDEALDSLQKVLALEPNHPGAHHKLAEVLARRGRFESAAEHLNKARRLGYRIDPDLEALVAKATQPNG